MVLLKKRDYGFSVVLVAPPRRSNQFNLHTMVIPTFKTFRKVKKIIDFLKITARFSSKN